jgi:putative nucleotidyltransferase with HDIG domain
MVDVEQAIGEIVERGEVAIAPWRGVAARIAALLGGRDVAMDELARLVSADPALSVQVLSAASARGRGKGPATLPQAIARIGEAELLRIAREAARGASAPRGPLDEQQRAAWRRSVACAVLCRELARLREIDPDEAWLCGLLHDVGRTACLSAIERLASGARLANAAGGRWDGLVDRWHVSLGVSLAVGLGLPRAVADVIALHHGVLLDPARSPEMVRMVRTTGAIVRVLWGDPAASGDEPAVGDLRRREAARLAPAVAALSAAVEVLERVPAPGPAGPGAAPGEPSPLHESKGAGVRLRLAGREYVAVSVGPQQLIVSGPAPLGEGALLEVELLERRGLVFHARVLLSWSEDDRFGAILMPFALAGPATLDWQGQVPIGATA